MRLICLVILLFYLVVTVDTLYGQQSLFAEVDQFDVFADSSRLKLIYFHFEGCAPCKKMNEEVLSDTLLSKKLSDMFGLYSVKGFDSIQQVYRNILNVTANPTFIFLDEKNNMRHKIVGFYNKPNFLSAARSAFTTSSLHHFDSIYCNSTTDIFFLRDYIILKDKANELDSTLIFEYLDKMSNPDYKDTMYLMDLVHYGFYRGSQYIKLKFRSC